MTTITIDTGDDVRVLEACRNMLNELLGEAPTVTQTIGDMVKPGGTATVSGSVESDGAGVVGTVIADSARVDIPGVAFNAEFCSTAQDPFYASGPRKGQWKRRKGVTEDAYDAWYAGQVKPGAAQTAADEEPVNTAGAFGAAETAEAVPAPTDCGAFMGWVSAKQAAGLLTQEDIGEAYTQAGVQVTDLFPPNDADTVTGHVGKLYSFLVDKAGA